MVPTNISAAIIKRKQDTYREQDISGFIRRSSYYFFPSQGSILSHGPQWFSNFYYDEKFKTTDNENIVDWLITFRNKATLTLVTMQDYVQVAGAI